MNIRSPDSPYSPNWLMISIYFTPSVSGPNSIVRGFNLLPTYRRSDLPNKGKESRQPTVFQFTSAQHPFSPIQSIDFFPARGTCKYVSYQRLGPPIPTFIKFFLQ